ncbi:hypothetical protein BD626DRAFT_512225 [Schizophyllum amplum]|uniref:Uncharacterized protein n=1 Tax=Schizophyllum amplum TaxID=97359 RepID=A0A550C0Q5_9AGAR|nr:hypothetical protein BD626DRAFT_512225 [Auriculariopsis ampla]
MSAAPPNLGRSKAGAQLSFTPTASMNTLTAGRAATPVASAKPAPTPKPGPKTSDGEGVRMLANSDKPCGYGGGYCTIA